MQSPRHINIKKCCYIHFEPSNRKSRVEHNEEEHVVIKQVKKVKFLGVIIDDQLKWDAHII